MATTYTLISSNTLSGSAASVCSIEGCNKSIKNRKMCAMHCSRLDRWGDVNITFGPPKITKTIEQYLSEKIINNDGCWTLSANLNHNGYTKIQINKKQVLMHRAVWEFINGLIKPGYDVDHMCHNEAAIKNKCAGGTSCKHRACFNPKHLRLATRSENVLAGSRHRKKAEAK